MALLDAPYASTQKIRMNREQLNGVCHDPLLHKEPTALDKLKLWNDAGTGIMGFCDVEGCAGKQPCKKIEPGLFVCRKHFFQLVT